MTPRFSPRVLLSSVLLSIMMGAVGLAGTFGLASPFTDHMVVQQKGVVRFWGWGTPGTCVRVQASWGAGDSAKVQADSTWNVRVRTPRAGGPYTIRCEHADTTVILNDVLSGEVWLCSGQSNMEMPLAGWPPGDTINNASREIADAVYPEIRMFQVRRAYSAVPEARCEGTWLPCSPTAAPGFSATAYFFGRSLHSTLGVPVGLIVASWGGTRAHAWLGGHALSRMPEYTADLKGIADCAEGQRRMREWLKAFPTVDIRTRDAASRWVGLDLGDSGCAALALQDSSWHRMNIPCLWETTALGDFDGVVWFRRRVSVPRAWVHKALRLTLGPVDDIDVTFVNGVRVGGNEGEGLWKVDRVYSVPADLVDSTSLLVAVRVIDYQGGGGIWGSPDSLALSAGDTTGRVLLAGEWAYLPVGVYSAGFLHSLGTGGNVYDGRPRLPFELSANSPTALYNGMIAPLTPYSIRGFIWYQGESDVDTPQRYRTVFPLLIENWRRDFRLDRGPFYFVQIAPYEYGDQTRSALLREAQAATLKVPGTGMAVTLDIGDPRNIHPGNKQEVGGRLARWALARTYGKNIPVSGPVYASSRRRGKEMEIRFTHTDGGVVVRKKGGRTGFQIAGADSIFKDADVRITGPAIFVSHPEIARPAAVRYAFTNAPEATLFNGAGLPAPSFRTDGWSLKH